MPIVDDEGDPLVTAVYFVDHGRKDESFGSVPVLFEGLTQFIGQRRPDLTEGVDQVRDEPDGVVVVLIDCQPRGGDTVGGQNCAPLCCKCALPETCRRVDDDKAPVLPGTHRFNQTRPINQ